MADTGLATALAGGLATAFTAGLATGLTMGLGLGLAIVLVGGFTSANVLGAACARLAWATGVFDGNLGGIFRLLLASKMNALTSGYTKSRQRLPLKIP